MVSLSVALTLCTVFLLDLSALAFGQCCVMETLKCAKHISPLNTFAGLAETTPELEKVCRLQKLFYNCLQNVTTLCGCPADVEKNRPFAVDLSLRSLMELCAPGSRTRERYLNVSSCINKHDTSSCRSIEFLGEDIREVTFQPRRCELNRISRNCIATELGEQCGQSASLLFKELTYKFQVDNCREPREEADKGSGSGPETINHSEFEPPMSKRQSKSNENPHSAYSLDVVEGEYMSNRKVELENLEKAFEDSLTDDMAAAYGMPRHNDNVEAAFRNADIAAAYGQHTVVEPSLQRRTQRSVSGFSENAGADLDSLSSEVEDSFEPVGNAYDDAEKIDSSVIRRDKRDMAYSEESDGYHLIYEQYTVPYDSDTLRNLDENVPESPEDYDVVDNDSEADKPTRILRKERNTDYFEVRDGIQETYGRHVVAGDSSTLSEPNNQESDAYSHEAEENYAEADEPVLLKRSERHVLDYEGTDLSGAYGQRTVPIELSALSEFEQDEPDNVEIVYEEIDAEDEPVLTQRNERRYLDNYEGTDAQETYRQRTVPLDSSMASEFEEIPYNRNADAYEYAVADNYAEAEDSGLLLRNEKLSDFDGSDNVKESYDKHTDIDSSTSSELEHDAPDLIDDYDFDYDAAVDLVMTENYDYDVAENENEAKNEDFPTISEQFVPDETDPDETDDPEETDDTDGSLTSNEQELLTDFEETEGTVDDDSLSLSGWKLVPDQTDGADNAADSVQSSNYLNEHSDSDSVVSYVSFNLSDQDPKLNSYLSYEIDSGPGEIYSDKLSNDGNDMVETVEQSNTGGSSREYQSRESKLNTRRNRNRNKKVRDQESLELRAKLAREDAEEREAVLEYLRKGPLFVLGSGLQDFLRENQKINTPTVRANLKSKSVETDHVNSKYIPEYEDSNSEYAHESNYLNEVDYDSDHESRTKSNKLYHSKREDHDRESKLGRNVWHRSLF